MGRPARQAIGKQLASNWQAVVKAGGWGVRPGEFARKSLAVNLQLGNAAENLLASHRGELPDLVRRELIPKDLRANSPQRKHRKALQILRSQRLQIHRGEKFAANSPWL